MDFHGAAMLISVKHAAWRKKRSGFLVQNALPLAKICYWKSGEPTLEAARPAAHSIAVHTPVAVSSIIGRRPLRKPHGTHLGTQRSSYFRQATAEYFYVSVNSWYLASSESSNHTPLKSQPTMHSNATHYWWEKNCLAEENIIVKKYVKTRSHE